MSQYASIADLTARMLRDLPADEEAVASALLEDAGVIIDGFAPGASSDAKKIVTCRMVIRALGDGDTSVPLGATQGSMSALGYTQSWTLGAGSGAGELYLGKLEKQMLGMGNRVGSYSPVQELAAEEVV